jgi:hypothetical protein
VWRVTTDITAALEQLTKERTSRILELGDHHHHHPSEMSRAESKATHFARAGDGSIASRGARFFLFFSHNHCLHVSLTTFVPPGRQDRSACAANEEVHPIAPSSKWRNQNGKGKEIVVRAHCVPRKANKWVVVEISNTKTETEHPGHLLPHLVSQHVTRKRESENEETISDGQSLGSPSPLQSKRSTLGQCKAGI